MLCAAGSLDALGSGALGKAGEGLFYDDAQASPFPKDEDNSPGQRDRQERARMDSACWQETEALIRRARLGVFKRPRPAAAATGGGWLGGEGIATTLSVSATAHVLCYYALFSAMARKAASSTWLRARKINPRIPKPGIVAVRTPHPRILIRLIPKRAVFRVRVSKF